MENKNCNNNEFTKKQIKLRDKLVDRLNHEIYPKNRSEPFFFLLKKMNMDSRYIEYVENNFDKIKSLLIYGNKTKSAFSSITTPTFQSAHTNHNLPHECFYLDNGFSIRTYQFDEERKNFSIIEEHDNLDREYN